MLELEGQYEYEPYLIHKIVPGDYPSPQNQ